MSWMTQTEAAAALGCSIRTVRRRIRAGSLTARREGRRLLVEIDTDRALSTVTQVGRHLAEVGAAAVIQRKQDADALTTIHETFKDTLSSLAACQDRAEKDIGTYRRSARRGWAMTSLLGALLAIAAWFIHKERVAHADALHVLKGEAQAVETAAETAIVTSEVRHVGEIRTVSAQREAEVTTLHEALDHERASVDSLEKRLSAATQTLADNSTDLRLVSDERDRMARESRLTAQRLQYTLLTSKLAGSWKDFWTSLRTAADQSAGLDRENDMQTAMGQLAAAHRAELTAIQSTHERELRNAAGKDARFADTLRTSLQEKEDTLQRFENRNNELANNLIATVSERSYLAAENDRLVRRVEELQTEVERLNNGENLASSVRSLWSALQTGWPLPRRGDDYASHTPTAP
ncbi:MAG: hypothetical protein IIC51_07215 [Planctomycetes bacterium]|nr:hypothetical protein [Planctomycetota bacterium]